MSHFVAPLEILFFPHEGEGAARRSIGIGDGGNEVGMGSVYDLVVNSNKIANAASIACTVPADHLIVA